MTFPSYVESVRLRLRGPADEVTGVTSANRIVQSSQPIILVMHLLTTNRRVTMPIVKVIKIVV